MVQDIPENVALEKSSQTAFSKAMKTLKSRVKKGEISVPTNITRRPNRGVMYLSHIPHGFYEKEMNKFFSQFGDITRLKLGRSKKTGRSKGYAFIEFRHDEVAQIAAETMNNYLMFTKLVKAKYLPPNEVSEAVFFGRTLTPQSCPGARARMLQRKLSNRKLTSAQATKRRGKARKRVAAMQEKLNELGIDYTIQLGGKDSVKMELPAPDENKISSKVILQTTALNVDDEERPTKSKKSPSRTPTASKSPKIARKSATPQSAIDKLIEFETCALSLKSHIEETSDANKILDVTPKSVKTPSGVQKPPRVLTPKMKKRGITVVEGEVEKYATKLSPAVTPSGKQATPKMEKPLSAKKTPMGTPKTSNIAKKSPFKKSPSATPKSTPKTEKPLSAKKTPMATPKSSNVAEQSPFKKTPSVTPKFTPKTEKPVSAKKTPMGTPKSSNVAEQSQFKKTSSVTPKSTPKTEKPLSAKKTPMGTPKSSNIAEQSPFKKTPSGTPKSTPKTEKPLSAKKTPMGTPKSSNVAKQSTPKSTPKTEKPLSAKKSPAPTNMKSTPKSKMTPTATEYDTEIVEEVVTVTKRGGRKSVIDMKTPSPRRTRSGKVLAGKSPLKSFKVQELKTMEEEDLGTPTRRSTRKSIAALKVQSPATPKVPKRYSLNPTPKSTKKSKLV